jgi:HAMP domain-containing protein
MKLRPRLTLFTIVLVALVVSITSVTSVFSLRYVLERDMESNQRTLFKNFQSASHDALYLGDDLAVQSYSESLERSVPGLAYAVFVDDSRPGIQLGGIESLQRFKRVKPQCPASSQEGESPKIDVKTPESEYWRTYCKEISLTNVRGNPIKGTVYLGFNLNFLLMELDAVIDRIWTKQMGVIAGVLLLGLISAYFLAVRLTRPIRHLTEGAKAIGEGNLETQIPIESADELGFLAKEFNLMADKLRELDQLKDDFISSVSHELRSPLSAIAGYVELLQSNSGFSELFDGKDGSLYGAIFGKDEAFRLDLDGSGFHSLHQFNLSDPAGWNLLAPLLRGSDGSIYGTTRNGGDVDLGVVFKLYSPVVSITRITVSGVNAQVSFSGGAAGQAYDIIASSSLSQPLWEVIGTRTAGSDGSFLFADPEASNYSNRFYRSVKP